MSRSARSGFALLASLILVVLLGALIVGVFVATAEETRIAASSNLAARGLYAAESAAQADAAGWVPQHADSLSIGERMTRTKTVGEILVSTTLIRLDSTLFWLVAEARSEAKPTGTGQSVRRRIGLLVRRVRDSTGQPAILTLEERPWSELF